MSDQLYQFPIKDRYNPLAFHDALHEHIQAITEGQRVHLITIFRSFSNDKPAAGQ
jgi:hypothetical protein